MFDYNYKQAGNTDMMSKQTKQTKHKIEILELRKFSNQRNGNNIYDAARFLKFSKSNCRQLKRAFQFWFFAS